jgi:hypothetical protein
LKTTAVETEVPVAVFIASAGDVTSVLATKFIAFREGRPRRLELRVGKLAGTVLSGPEGRKALRLPGR